MIDVGGPSMLRGAAKNFAHVTPVCRPERLRAVLAELRETGELSLETRRDARGDRVRDDRRLRGGDRVAGSPDARRSRPCSCRSSRSSATSPTARTRTRARRTTPSAARGRTCSHASSSCTAGALVQQPERPERRAAARARVRAAGMRDRQAREPVRRRRRRDRSRRPTTRALAADPISAYGGVVVSTAPSARRSASALAEQFVEVLFAPGYDEVALEALVAEAVDPDPERPRAPQLRGVGARLQARPRRPARPGPRLGRRRPRGDGGRLPASPTRRSWGDLLFAWRVCKHVASNAIVIAKDLQTIGIGAGQMSRVDAVRIAVEKAASTATRSRARHSPRTRSSRSRTARGSRSTRASRALIQPGGSKRDADVIDAVESAGAAMVFTGRRHFRH